MTDQPYSISLTSGARRALAERLLLDVVIGVTDFLAGPLAQSPHRVGKELNAPREGTYSARVMREYRVLYVIDDDRRIVTVQSIRHRRDAYHT